MIEAEVVELSPVRLRDSCPTLLAEAASTARKPLSSLSAQCNYRLTPKEVECRLLSMGKLYEERREKAREEREAQRRAEEVASMKNWRECVPPSTLTWSDSVERSSALQRSEKCRSMTEERDEELTWKPKVCSKSAKLAHKRKVEEGLSGLDPVESLMERKKRADERLEERKKAEMSRYTFTPCVTEMAKEVNLPLTASERLYEHARERELEYAQLKSEAQDIFFVPSDTQNKDSAVQVSFKPLISDRAAKLTRKAGHSVHEDLYRFAREKIEEQGSTVFRDPACTFQPKVNATSLAIAASLRETTADRLQRPRQSRRKTSATREETIEPASSVKPHRVSSLPRASSNLSLYDRQQLWLEMKRKKIRQAHEIQQREEANACTFHPVISPLGQRVYSSDAHHAEYQSAPELQERSLSPSSKTFNFRGMDEEMNAFGAARIKNSLRRSSLLEALRQKGSDSTDEGEAEDNSDFQTFLDILDDLERPRMLSSR